jgi:ubiquinone/menaquinone biosynthesis C-methylase UbiE
MKRLLNDYIARYSMTQRDSKISLLSNFLSKEDFVLDVGVWSDMPEPNPSENWLEKKYGNRAKIIAIGLHDMRKFREKYPGVLCVQADGSALPFMDNAVASAFSNAVLEHVPASRQAHFVEEFTRVTRHKAILAVPDRFSPIEIHSRIFFLHWLPFWREIFRLLGEEFWASERNLSSIFTKNGLKKLLNSSSDSGTWEIKRQYFMLMPVSLIAIFAKE